MVQKRPFISYERGPFIRYKRGTLKGTKGALYEVQKMHSITGTVEVRYNVQEGVLYKVQSPFFR